MGRLTHIDDVESAQKVVSALADGFADQEEQATEAPTAARKASQAADDAAFHGLDDIEPLGVGHTALIVIACIVLAIAAAYIANAQLHFL